MRNTFLRIFLVLVFVLGICVSVNAQEDIKVYNQNEQLTNYANTYNTTSNDITYTVNVNLPDIDEKDVSFTVYASVENNVYSKKGMVNSGEKSVTLELTGLPINTRYKTWIEFDYHKYKNAILEDFEFLNIAYAKDFKTDFTAGYSRVVVCNVSLPDDFVPANNVEVKIELSKYRTDGSMSVVNSLTDWDDSKMVTLSNEKRSEQIYLYSQAKSSMLSYSVISGNNGLCKKGYLDVGGKIASDNNSQKEITEDSTFDIPLLRRKNITVMVYRPFSLSLDNDIFATVELNDISTLQSNDITMNFTQTPLIPSGERKSQFEIEIAEDKIYKLKIKDIAGDDRLFDYYCYVEALESPADEGKKKLIAFSDDLISLTLLQCNNILGTVKCDKTDLSFTVLATCNLHNGETIRLISDVENGEFSFKIPEDTDTYTLDVQTQIGKKSYYVSNGVSTNSEDEATEIFFEYNDDKDIVLEYILQNPPQPIEISTEKKYDHFIFENISDYSVEEFDVYIAYYDKNDSLMSIEKTEESDLISGLYLKIPRNTADYKIKRVKAFAWEKSNLAPLGNVAEVSVNMPEIPEQNISVFKIGDKNAIVNGIEEFLTKAPEEINATMYILASDFEKLGYKVIADEAEIYIENSEMKFKFMIDEYAAVLVDNDISYEISAPILKTDEILLPVDVISNLFGQKSGWHNEGKIVIINMPFYDIEYSDVYCEAILGMYNRGVITGYDDGSFHPTEAVLRSEAAVCFSRTMGHELLEYEFECSDVSFDYWAKSWIGICVGEKVFELEGNKFRPDDYITVEEAMIAVLKMKGIDNDNYIESSQESGLLTNINPANLERNITRSELMQLLYNADE